MKIVKMANYWPFFLVFVFSTIKRFVDYKISPMTGFEPREWPLCQPSYNHCPTMKIVYDAKKTKLKKKVLTIPDCVLNFWASVQYTKLAIYFKHKSNQYQTPHSSSHHWSERTAKPVGVHRPDPKPNFKKFERPNPNSRMMRLYLCPKNWRKGS